MWDYKGIDMKCICTEDFFWPDFELFVNIETRMTAWALFNNKRPAYSWFRKGSLFEGGYVVCLVVGDRVGSPETLHLCLASD